MRGLLSVARAVVCAAAVTVMIQPVAGHAEPPGIPDAGAARALLDGLTVAEEGSAGGYSREEFPHWHTVSGECTTRETVLQRDGTDVVVDAECRATAGTWYSAYDDQTVTAASDIDIDHVVALAEAWRSGASEWSIERREEFANDLTNPQLIAVTASSNRSKGDQDPADWMPPNPAVHCTYAQMWVGVKSSWALTVQQAEKDKLATILQSC
ncbi:HNH endonuclease family protein [Nocardia flavorosea]|uniref:HNH endonuclease family protein n=1 Tax=Nocardia flavorosea TaxID=53429 RepID=UPI002458F60C|nr:HNH endonuclease family protein [Nocardia flavorosea]